MVATKEASGLLERFEEGEPELVMWEEVSLHWPLTLQHRHSGLSSDPGGGWVLVEVVPPRLVAGSALVRPGVVQREAWHSQHTYRVHTIRRVDWHPPPPGAIPQLPERVRSVELRVPPLDFWGGVTYYITVQLKGVACEFSLGQGWFHKARWCWWWFKEAGCAEVRQTNKEVQDGEAKNNKWKLNQNQKIIN